ncbi:MAG: PAS domain S-box protein [Kiritimatiellae bacterium]|nr:PAS domain S-box protein [Kiritimatiellia bacterium]
MMSLSYFLVIYLIPSTTTSENIFLVFFFSLILSLAGYIILIKITKSILELKNYVENVAMGNLKPPALHDNAAEVDDIIELVSRIHQKLQDVEQARAQMEKAAIIEAMPDPLFVIDLDGIIMRTNPAQEKVFGRKAATMVGKRFDELLHAVRPLNPEEFAQLPGKVIETGEAGPEEIVIITSDGREIPASIKYSLLKNAEGMPVYIVAVMRDITELKRASAKEKELAAVTAEAIVEKKKAAELEKTYKELKRADEALRENEKNQRRLLESMINAFAIFESVFDDAGQFISCRFVFINDAYELITGVKYKEVKGKTIHEVWPRTEPEWINRLGEVAVTGIFQTFDMYHDPTQKSYHCNVYRPWNTKDRFCVIFEDITDIKRAAAENAKLENELQQAHKMESVGRLAGGVAHDFNNILQIILGNIELALARMEPDDPLRDDLEEVQIAGRRAADLTRQLLGFARKQTIAPRTMDLNATVASMLKMLRRLMGEDIETVWTPGAGLWPIRMDPVQIDQILVNLCANARDVITDTGTVQIATENVRVDEQHAARHDGVVPGDYVLLKVSDTGCGMDAETQSKIFEPFFTTKPPGKGAGLGLATVYGIVKQNHGYIGVYSEPGMGTTLHIYLPRYMGNEKAPAVESPAKPLTRGSGLILLVEDDLSLLGMCSQILTKLGYGVLAAGTPDKACYLAEEHADEIRVLVTDVIMPGMNGRELATRIKTRYPHINCLFMSGFTADIIARQGLLKKSDHFIQKPFSMGDLAAKINETLNDSAG